MSDKLCVAGNRFSPRSVFLGLLMAGVLAMNMAVAAQASSGTNLVSDPVLDPLYSRPAILGDEANVSGNLLARPCSSASASQLPLTLSEAVDFALCNNPQIKAAWSAMKMEAAGVGAARAAYLPSLSLNTSRLNTRTTYPDVALANSSVQGQTANISLNWRIFDFGTRESNRLAANNLLLAAMASHDAALQKTLAATVQAYFDTQSALAALQAKDESRAIAIEMLNSASRRAASGNASHADVLQATTALAKAALEHSRADGAYHKAMSVLAYTMGAPADSTLIFPQENIEYVGLTGDKATPNASIDNLQAWLAAASQFHPEIRASRAQWQSAIDKISAARGEGLPTIDFNANQYKNGYPGQGISATSSNIRTVGISVNFPIFDGLSHTYKVRQAQARAEQLEAQLADTEHSVSMEIVKVYSDTLAAWSNLQSSQMLFLAAQDALASSQRRYAKGIADIAEILNVQNSLADAKQEKIACIAEWRSARLRLLVATGKFDRAGIENIGK